MPWELGYFDALKNSRVAVLPISQTAKNAYKGSEYIGVYFVVQFARISGSTKDSIWVYDDERYVIYDSWLKGYNPSNY